MRLLALVVLFAGSGFAQVEIRASRPNTMPEMRSRLVRGRYEVTNATAVDLIRTAWGVDADKVVGGPDWLDLDRFDVLAPSTEALPVLLRRILAERFQLAARTEMKGAPAYAISVGRKLQVEKADGSGRTGCELNPGGDSVELVCRNMTMAAFASAVQGVREASGYLFGYPVVDRTGLTGEWNFKVEWSPRVAMRASPAAANAVTIFDAFEKQLGLKLELIQLPTQVVGVESVKKPTLNPAEAAGTPLQFEVADIKPGDGSLRCGYIDIQRGGRVRIDMTLRGLVLEAWGAQIPPDRILGDARALDGPCFEIVAKAPVDEDSSGGANTAGWKGPVWNGVDVDSMRTMLRALLVERFGLQAHTEDRLLAGYELVATKPKLRRAEAGNRAGCREGPGPDGKDPRLSNPMAPRLVTCRNMTVARFAAELNGMFPGAPRLVDGTGLAGRYDMTINFSPASLMTAEPNGAISLAEALNGQLGLKLQARKVTTPVLVVDRVDAGPRGN